MAAEMVTFRSAAAVSGGITLHTGDWLIEALDFGTPGFRDEQVTSADTDGVALSRVAKREAVEFTIRVRLQPQPDMGTALTKLEGLEAALATAESAYVAGITDPGLDAARLIWQPAGSSVEGIMPVIRAGISERPIEVSGENAGWFLNAPVFTITGLRDPFVYGPLTQQVQSSASGSPLGQEITVPAVGGSVPPWVKVTVEDTVASAGQARNQMLMGLEVPKQATTLTFLAGSGAGKLDPAGLAGSVSAGRVTCTSLDWVGAAQLNGADHRGQYRVIACLAKATSDPAAIRLRWGVTGQAPLTLNSQVSVPQGFYADLDLGMVSVDRDTGGSWVGMLEVFGNVSLAGIMLVPMSEWVSAETAPGSSALGVKVVDGNLTGSGSLSGSALTLPAGQSWSVTGTWTKQTGYVERTAVSEGSRQTALAGTSTYGGVRVSCEVLSTAGAAGLNTELGVLLRYVDVNNLVVARLVPRSTLAVDYIFKVTALVGGTGIDLLGSAESRNILGAFWYGSWHRLVMSIDTQGRYEIFYGDLLVKAGQHPALATGGVLASGKIGLADRRDTAYANGRRWRNFVAHGTVSSGSPILPAQKTLELAPAGMVTVDGTNRLRVSHRGGAIMPPANLDTRLLVATRRFNGMAMTEAEGKVDNQKVTVSARKRWVQVP